MSQYAHEVSTLKERENIVIDPDFDPLAILDELAHEMVRLNQRQHQLEQFLTELAGQNANIADHLAEQSRALNEIYRTLGKMNSETE
jgi:predicted  nucleic acid-binding Zn-ribbon protein